MRSSSVNDMQNDEEERRRKSRDDIVIGTEGNNLPRSSTGNSLPHSHSSSYIETSTSLTVQGLGVDVGVDSVNGTGSNGVGSFNREGVLINTEDAETLAQSISMKPINAMAYTPTTSKSARGSIVSHLAGTGTEDKLNSNDISRGLDNNCRTGNFVDSSTRMKIDNDNLTEGDILNSLSNVSVSQHNPSSFIATASDVSISTNSLNHFKNLHLSKDSNLESDHGTFNFPGKNNNNNFNNINVDLTSTDNTIVYPNLGTYDNNNNNNNDNDNINNEYPHIQDDMNIRARVGTNAVGHHVRRSSMNKAHHDDYDTRIGASDGVVVVSYFLPVQASRDPETNQWIIEWDSESLLSLRTRLRVVWIGIVREAVGLIKSQEDEESLAAALQQYDCVPVFVTEEQHEQCFKRLCKGILWPVFHHILDIYNDVPTRFLATDDGVKVAHSNIWSVYKVVNMKFRDKIVEVYQEQDLIWLHGFHLLMLPSFISKALPTSKVSLFLHTPFPSSEIFRTLSVREDLLRGMLNADHIGFHLYEYARHFLTCVRRLLGLTYEMENGQLIIHYNGRNVAISCLHVGLDTSLLYKLIDTDPIRIRVEELRKEYEGKQVIVGVDRLERIRGLPLKLLMYERMLENHPEMRGKVVLLQFGILARETGEDFVRTQKEVAYLVSRINEKYLDSHPNWKPVTFNEREENTIRHPDRLPYFILADVLLISSPRDGLNRLPMEFVAAHSKYRPQNPGVTLLSEFVSCMRVLRGCLVLNPWKITQASKLLYEALTLPMEQKVTRHKADAEYVSSHTTLHWAYQILTDLKAVRKDFDRRDMSSMGLGMGFRVLGMEAGFQQLKVENVVKAYRTARKRLILFDYGGTLVDNNEQKESVAYYAVSTKQEKREGPEKHVIEGLIELCKDSKNHVYVVTGKDKTSLEEYFNEVPDLGIGAEHGFYVRRPKGSRWEAMVPSFDVSWMHIARNIMEVYSSRTHGTYIEQKESALIWQYREADPEFGQMQSKELEDHLAGVLRGYPVEVLHGENNPMQGGYVEVRPENMDKGVFLADLLKRMEESNAVPDMVLCLGDDASDEFMFNVLEEYVEKHPEKSKSYFACTVGKKPSTAQTFLNDTTEVHHLINSLGKVSRLNNRAYGGSSVNLRSLGMMNYGGPTGGLVGLNPSLTPFGMATAITEEEETEDEGLDMELDGNSSKMNRFSIASSIQTSEGSFDGESIGMGTAFNTDFNKFTSPSRDQGISPILTGNKRKLGQSSRSFSMNDMASRDPSNRSPKSMTWSKYVQTIQEGNDEAIFF